jgi:parallel beta-helix repeat protein
LSGNNVANNVKGIELSYDVELGRIGCFSDNNVLSGNNVTANNEEGILLSSSSNNTLSGNNVANNGYGIWIVSISFHPLTKSASGNSIYHNNFINNTPQELIGGGYANTWDDGYPSGGNYWSDYAGVDVKRGLNQNMDGNDGVGDTPYVIDANNTDRYPLMNPCGNPLSAYNLTITVAVGGTTDPAFGNYSYAYGTNVTVTAIPDAGYSLDHWLLDGNNAGNTRSIIVSMTSNHALQPVFARISTPPYLPVSLLLAALLITLVVVILTVKLKRRKKGPPPQTLP